MPNLKIMPFLVLCLLMMPVLVLASPPKQEKPKEIDSVIQANAPIGSGTLSFWGFKGYDAYLWTDGDNIEQTTKPFALSIQYARDIPKEDLISYSLQEMKRLSGLQDDRLRLIKTNLMAAYPDVKSGDRITALTWKDDRVAFYHNGSLTAEIKNPVFANNFYLIWLDENTSWPSLRAGLLNKNE